MVEDLPRGWARTSLGQIVRKARPKIPADPKSELPFIGMDHIEPHSFDLVGQDKFAKMKSAGSYFLPGDVLYGRLRPYLNKVHKAKFEGVASAEFIVLPGSDYHDSDFLKYLLHQRSFIEFAMSRSSGDRPRVKFNGIADYEFPLPPLNEQRRIVEKIETLFARLDKGEEAVREVQTLLKRYRQSVLKAAVTGALTSDWRAESAGQLEHGQDLLARILKTREENWQGRGKYKAPVEPDTRGLPQLPKGWIWASIEQLGYIQSGQTPKGVEAHVVQSGTVPWFKVSSMNDLGNEMAMYTSKWMFTKESAEVAKLNILPAGTIAFPKRGGAILTNKKRRLGVPGALDLNTMGFVPIALEGYLWIYFQGLDLRTVYDGSNVPQINYHDIADLFVAVPPKDEAKVICEEVELRMGQIAKLEEWCATELKRSASLRQSILKDAFAGRLVPQDPSDEPAGDLLARIAEVHGEATKSKRPRKIKEKA